MVAGSACVIAVHVGFGMGFVEVKGLWQPEKLLASHPTIMRFKKVCQIFCALYPLIRVSCKMKDVVIFPPMEVTH